MTVWAVIAGGGTAGHTLPAISIARALVSKGHLADQIHFVGSRRGLESRLVPEAGFGISLLPGRGIVRRLSLQNAGALVALLGAICKAVLLVRRLRPSVVVSVGGYASVPCGIAAVVLRIPLVVAEANGVAGAANRLVGRFARAAAVAYPGTGLPREVVTGNPVRPEILAVDCSAAGRASAREALGIPLDRHVLAVFGGSLGSRRINDAAIGLVRGWSTRNDVAVRHAVGKRDWTEVSTRLPPPSEGGIVYQPVEYEADMPLVLAACDLVLSRAGATTVAELAVVGRPSILVPLPIAPRDHQAVNARALSDAGAAVFVRDAVLDADWLMRTVGELFADPERLSRMGRVAAGLGRRDAADRVAEVVERHARS